MPTLLFEIGCEELPAASVYEAQAQLPGLAQRHLGVKPERVYVGPRRLAIFVTGLEEKAEDQWVKGPPVALREQAAAGFAKRHGVSVEDLEERDGFLGVVSRGQALSQVLPGQLDEIVRGLRFGKTMRWDDSGLRFPRPIRWTCARLDDAAVNGLGTTTQGHRFSHGEVELAIGKLAQGGEALRAGRGVATRAGVHEGEERIVLAGHVVPQPRLGAGDTVAVVDLDPARGLHSAPEFGAYVAFVCAVVALTHALAISLGPEVRVNAIAPGWIATDAWKPRPRRKPSALRASDHAQHPVGRVGRPEDVADCALYLVSDAAGFLTGQVITLDGGMTRKMIYAP